MLMGRADMTYPGGELDLQRGLWIIVLFYHSGCLQTLQLERYLDRWVVSQSILGFIPVAGCVNHGVAWLIATIVAGDDTWAARLRVMSV